MINALKSLRTKLLTNGENVSRATNFILILIICCIVFPIRYVFHTTTQNLLGDYSDFTALSIYSIDFLLITFIGLTLFHVKLNRLPKKFLMLFSSLLAWLVLEFLFNHFVSVELGVFSTIHIILAIALSLAIAISFVPRETISWVFIILGITQTTIGLIQFGSQHSLGLNFFGESPLNLFSYGVAKIVAHGTTILRPYGTFPHSNIFGIFLLMATLQNLYLILKSQQNYQKITKYLLYLTLSINILGIFLSFSRISIICLFFSIFAMWYFYSNNGNRLKEIRLKPILFSISLSLVLLVPTFSLLNRSSSLQENSIKERISANDFALKSIYNSPLIGTGSGQSLLHMKQQNPDLKSWELIPTHNFWLISTTELGFGAVFMFLLILLPIIGLFKRKFTIWIVTLISTLLAFFIASMFDHYFYTVWQSILLFWIFIGLAIREVIEDDCET